MLEKVDGIGVRLITPVRGRFSNIGHVLMPHDDEDFIFYRSDAHKQSCIRHSLAFPHTLARIPAPSMVATLQPKSGFRADALKALQHIASGKTFFRAGQ